MAGSTHNRWRAGTQRRATRLWIASVVMLTACSELPTDAVEDTRATRVHAALVGTAFVDEFAGFDAGFWQTSTHTLGRGPLVPENVTVADGQLRLATTREGFRGAEILSRGLYGSGTFTARARCAAPPGVVCAFFLYQTGVGDRADEIDIELQAGTRTIWFTTWVRGRRTNHREVQLSFDPAQGLHEYTIVRGSDAIEFRVDGQQLAIFRKAKTLPKASMPLFANTWWPTWLTPGSGNGVWEIDAIGAY